MKLSKFIKKLGSFFAVQEIEQKIHVEDYLWLPTFFEELGFTRRTDISYDSCRLTGDFITEEHGLSLTLMIEFSPRKKSWDVITVRLCQIDNPLVEKHWSIWRSSLDENKLKDEIRYATRVFSEVSGDFVDDDEPIYLFERQTTPILKGIEYHIANKEKWILADNYGNLFLEAYRLGYKKVEDIRPVKIQSGLWDGKDKDGRCIGGTMWDKKYGGIITINN